MSNIGFYIKKVWVVGNNVNAATIEFGKGVNLISGPSDTGKSYIFECLDYILGSSKEPKKIGEAKGYNSVLMEIELYSGGSYTIKRSFRKEEVEVYPTSIELIEGKTAETLKWKHDKDRTDNLSAYYLKKSGYEHPIYVRKNKKGETRTLSFRDLPLYVSISEDKVIKSNSPIMSGQYTTKTVEKSIFNYLVSGIEIENNKQSKNEIVPSVTVLEGQIELLDKLVLKEKQKLESIKFEKILPTKTLADKMNDIQVALEYIDNEIEQQTANRRMLWNKLEEDKSRIIADTELIKRFKLLKEYYDTDLKRLSFVIEGNYYFSQLNLALCPYCNQRLNEESVEHSCEFYPSEDLTISVEAEIGKIKGKLNDLESTLEHAEIDHLQLQHDIEKNQEKYNKVKEKIDFILQPKQFELQNIINSYIKERDLYTEYQALNDKLAELKNEKKLISNQLKDKRKTKTVNSKDNDGTLVSSIDEFCEYLSGTLKRWKFSDMPKVRYDNGEFYIDSKLFGDYGKGYRAILYSGFAISFMQYCRAKDIPHPGFVVLDSPLTTYKGKKSTNDVSGDIQDAFFKDLATLGDNMQIIILDNKEPSEDVKEKIKFEEFTKDLNNGRYGFFQLK